MTTHWTIHKRGGRWRVYHQSECYRSFHTWPQALVFTRYARIAKPLATLTKSVHE